MLDKTAVPLLTCFLLAATPALAAEKVALRAPSGRFLRAGDDGGLRATSALVGDSETFELTSRGKDGIALTAPGGRAVVMDARDRTLRLAPPATGQGQIFQLVPAGAARFALRPAQPLSGRSVPLVLIDPSDTRPAAATAALPACAATARDGRNLPRPPAAGAVGKHFVGHCHHASPSRNLPASSTTKLVPSIRPRKSNCRAHAEGPQAKDEGPGVGDDRGVSPPGQARREAWRSASRQCSTWPPMPMAGRGWCSSRSMPSCPSAATCRPRFTTWACRHQLSRRDRAFGRGRGRCAAVGRRREARPCTVTDLHVSFARLDLSNDLLEAAHRPIKNFINRELHRNEERLRQEREQFTAKGDLLPRGEDSAAGISTGVVTARSLLVGNPRDSLLKESVRLVA